MIPVKYLLQHKDIVIEKLKKKFFYDLEVIDQIDFLYAERKSAQIEHDNLLAIINTKSKEIGKFIQSNQKDKAEEMKKEINDVKIKVKDINVTLTELDNQMQEKLIHVPNLPHESVPEGNKPEDNHVVKENMDPSIRNKKGLAHWDILDKKKFIDFQKGTIIAGSGFPVFSADMAKLVRSLIRYFIDFNVERGYVEYLTPLLVNEKTAFGTGQLPDKEGQMYHVVQDGLYLIPTSEVSLTNLYFNEIINEGQLPIKLTGYTPCFRREAGSYGKDVRGLNRVHQFDKVEIVQISSPEKSYDILDNMVFHVETLIQTLELPYRILKLCGGDMSFTSSLTYDFEVYALGQKKWLEVSSVSNFESFQANRMKIRIKKTNGQKVLAHTLNGSSLALPRILAAIIENNFDDDCVKIPPVIVPYFGADKLRL